jgi:excisionase family DNA binding protein
MQALTPLSFLSGGGGASTVGAKTRRPRCPPERGGAPGAVLGEVPRLALTVSEAAEALGVSDFLREHIAPELRWVRRGRRNLVSMRELEAWLEREAKRTLE